MDENEIGEALGSFLQQYATEDGGIDMVGLSGWFIELYKQLSNPTLNDWEDLQVTVKNTSMMFNQLIEQEKVKLVEEMS